MADDLLYFHAHFRRESPCDGWGPDLQVNGPESQVPNLDGGGNYVILETAGAGNCIGCNLAVAHLQGTWSREGDDMIFVDDDAWPPSIHGTGGEHYFNHGWGMQRNASPMCGTIVHEADVLNFQISCNFHLTDPVRFNERIKVTMVHGHANHLADDWSSTAYWYQTLPSPRLAIPPVAARLPRRPDYPPRQDGDRPAPSDDPRHHEMRSRRDERFASHLSERGVWFQRRAADSLERSRMNRVHASDVRQRFIRS